MLQNFERLDLTLLKRSITRHASGLYVLPHPEAMHEVAAIDPDNLRRFFGLLRAAFNTVVIDTSKGLQASDFAAFELSDVILVVIQLDLICLRNTSRLIALFRQFDGLAERVKLVVNRSGSLESEISREEGRRDPEDARLLADTQRVATFQEARIKGVPLVGDRQGQPAPPGFPRHRPIAEPGPRAIVIEAPQRFLRGLLLTGCPNHRRGTSTPIEYEE